jgi:hypothetical protein
LNKNNFFKTRTQTRPVTARTSSEPPRSGIFPTGDSIQQPEKMEAFAFRSFLPNVSPGIRIFQLKSAIRQETADVSIPAHFVAAVVEVNILTRRAEFVKCFSIEIHPLH